MTDAVEKVFFDRLPLQERDRKSLARFPRSLITRLFALFSCGSATPVLTTTFSTLSTLYAT
jgi:hypothetical protein